MSNTIVSNFGNYNPIDPAVIAYVNAAIATANADSVQASPPSVANGIAQYVDTSGKLIKSTPYTMPDTLGVAGQVLTVDAGGDIIYGAGGGSNPFDQDLNTFNDVSFNSVTTANITGPTTVKVAGNDRLVVDATETKLYSQDVLTGPTGSFLQLKNTDEFTLGTRFSNNGTLECGINSMALVGRATNSAIVLTDSSITTSLTNGSGRIDREIMTQTGQEFRDGNNVIRLGITNSDGVVINNAFSLPTTAGAVGDIMTRTGATSTTWSPPAIPSYINNLTVTNLSQGPSALVQNYTLPNYAPTADQVITSAGSYVLDMIGSLPITFQLATINNGTQNFNIQFGFRDTTVEGILDALNVVVRETLSRFNCIAEIIFRYNSLTNRFGFDLLPNPAPSNFLFLRWEGYISGVNSNNLFGITTTIDLTISVPSATAPDPSAATLSTNCVWRSLSNIPVSNIQSTTGTSSIQCEDVGIGQNGIVSYGNYNLNNGSLNNIGNINALDNCNITTNTTQIVNGLGELNININSLPRITQDSIKTKLECGVSSLQLAAVSDGMSEDTTTYIGASNLANTENTVSIYLPNDYQILQNNGAIQRMVVDNNKSALYSKNATSGPAGSLLELNNDNTFTLGCYFANNGIIECRPNSLAMYGNAAQSAITMTDLNIITSLGVGGRVDREILDTTSQTFKDSTGTERLRVDNLGVTISNDYTLPIFDGSANQVLTTDGAGTTTWQTPIALNPFNQTLDTTSNVVFNSIQCNSIDASTPLPMVVAGTIASQIIIGNAATPTTLNGPTIVGQLLTANSGVKTNNIDSITGGSMTISGTTSSAVDIGRTGITTTLKGTTSINSLFTMPTTAGNTGDVLTKNGLGGTVWSAPQINGLYSQTAVQTVANTNVETTLIGAGVGSLSVPANYFTTGMAFRYSTGGQFRDAANNTVFRFRLRNGGILFDSGNLTLPNITVSTAWNIECLFSYVGGTTLITNFTFTYNNGSDSRGFTSQNTNNTLNTTIPNTLNLTIQWTVANANNTITSNFGVLTKIY